MSRLQDVLRKLNKGKAEEDIIKKVSDQSDEYFVKDTTSTGSPLMDIMTGGGYAQGGYNTIIAEGGAGKTSCALLAIAEEQRKTGRVGVYYDGEGTVDDSYIDRMGVDRSKLIYIKDRNLEEMLDTVEAFSTADEVGIINIDSIPIFVSSVVEQKSASDNNMAVEARKWGARMPIIEGNAMRRNITLIGLTSYKMDPGAMGDPRKLSRGRWQYTMSNVILDLTKKGLLKDENKKTIGHVIEYRVKKTKRRDYEPTKAFPINFYYDYGFNKYSQMIEVFIEGGQISDLGSGMYTYSNINGEEVKIRGRQKLIDTLMENEEQYNILLNDYNG